MQPTPASGGRAQGRTASALVEGARGAATQHADGKYARGREEPRRGQDVATGASPADLCCRRPSLS